VNINKPQRRYYTRDSDKRRKYASLEENVEAGEGARGVTSSGAKGRKGTGVTSPGRSQKGVPQSGKAKIRKKNPDCASIHWGNAEEEPAQHAFHRRSSIGKTLQKWRGRRTTAGGSKKNRGVEGCGGQRGCSMRCGGVKEKIESVTSLSVFMILSKQRKAREIFGSEGRGPFQKDRWRCGKTSPGRGQESHSGLSRVAGIEQGFGRKTVSAGGGGI